MVAVPTVNKEAALLLVKVIKMFGWTVLQTTLLKAVFFASCKQSLSLLFSRQMIINDKLPGLTNHSKFLRQEKIIANCLKIFYYSGRRVMGSQIILSICY
jgi:hypothetical protein